MMFPNSDFAYDAEKEKFFAVKDYSPPATLNPNYAERIKVAHRGRGTLYGRNSRRLEEHQGLDDAGYRGTI